MRHQEQESLTTFSTDLLQTTTATTTAEGTACFSTATELAPSLPVAEMSPTHQQDTTAQASTSLPLLEPKQQLGSEPTHAPRQQQGPTPAAQKEVEEKEVTAIPACRVSVISSAPDVTTEDHSELMPSSVAGDTDAVLAETADISYPLGLPEMVPPPQSSDQEVHVSRKKDTVATSVEVELKGSEEDLDVVEELEMMEEELDVIDEGLDMMKEGLGSMEEGLGSIEEGLNGIEEELDGIEEELEGIEEETDSSEEPEGSESHTLTAPVSASSHIFEDRMRD